MNRAIAIHGESSVEAVVSSIEKALPQLDTMAFDIVSSFANAVDEVTELEARASATGDTYILVFIMAASGELEAASVLLNEFFSAGLGWSHFCRIVLVDELDPYTFNSDTNVDPLQLRWQFPKLKN